MNTALTPTATITLTVLAVRETWPAGLLTYEADVRLPGGREGVLTSRASIYLPDPGRVTPTSRLRLPPGTGRSCAWVGLATAAPGDTVTVTFRGIEARGFVPAKTFETFARAYALPDTYLPGGHAFTEAYPAA